MEKFYVEIFESKRFHGTRLIKVVEFDTEKQMDEFITEYNTQELDYSGAVPETYTMAQTASWANIKLFKKGLLP